MDELLAQKYWNDFHILRISSLNCTQKAKKIQLKNNKRASKIEIMCEKNSVIGLIGSLFLVKDQNK